LPHRLFAASPCSAGRSRSHWRVGATGFGSVEAGAVADQAEDHRLRAWPFKPPHFNLRTWISKPVVMGLSPGAIHTALLDVRSEGEVDFNPGRKPPHRMI
jgi:hypothetical protein